LNERKLLAKIQSSSKNIRYGDFVRLIEAFGFKRIRGEGSHNIYERKDVPEMVNIQNDNGKAKPYQIKQFVSLIEKYNLLLGD
jgi:predicted RNA binding protein YcfA (HicA-like mRNA interferase family)